MIARGIRIRGIVQGVGFRPFVHRLATRYGLKGTVLNDTEGVLVHVEGGDETIDNFVEAIEHEAPRPAQIDAIEIEDSEIIGAPDFKIIPSRHREGEVTSISPDLATCENCLGELMDRSDRRFFYPFINCTHCGPRYSIIRELPYDRPKTSMAPFDMCDDCAAEYSDISDRRYHAQPNACEKCGPHYELLDSKGEYVDHPDPVFEACRLLRDGEIIAVKGIGGFHLMADARNRATVARLRESKKRPAKPFALMVKDIDTAKKLCEVSTTEASQLETPAAPIVLLMLSRDPEIELPETIAPELDRLGVFLPYAPIHHIIMAVSGIDVLIATSGNRRDEPIVCRNDEAIQDLQGIADAYLVHNREIIGRTDDSVGFVFEGDIVLTRRSRGYVPRSVKMPVAGPPVLAVGADLKGCFAITRGNKAYLSPYLGDLSGEKSFELFEEVLNRYLVWLKVEPKAIVCDLHPDYQSTILAEKYSPEWDIPLHRIQHHYAHSLSVIAEHCLQMGPHIAVAFDGHGYGADATIWGGEFFLVDGTEYERIAHIATVSQPGGDIAARDARRMAMAWAQKAYGNNFMSHIPKIVDSLGDNVEIIAQIVSEGNTTITSSAGRLFDAVACLLDICCYNSFEGECPQKLTAIADTTEKRAYRFPIENNILDPSTAIRNIITDRDSDIPPSIISMRFHNGLAKAIVEMAEKQAANFSTKSILLTGGVFQNPLLLELVVHGLRTHGLTPHWNSAVPPGDSGVALGQALYGSIINEIPE